ncbi:MAG TPA: MoaD/ThiS family protein [Desulfomonilaceae bacterium]|nr:MoaD/ThiS family protein [Desulfomonilaceae bacterium]
MKIDLNLFASLAPLLPAGATGHSCILEMSGAKTVRELLNELNIPDDMPKIVFLNGLHAHGDEVLKDGDRLTVFPPIAGG